MTPNEALKYAKRGGKLYEPLNFDATIQPIPCRIIHISATNPRPEGDTIESLRKIAAQWSRK